MPGLRAIPTPAGSRPASTPVGTTTCGATGAGTCTTGTAVLGLGTEARSRAAEVNAGTNSRP